MVMVAAFVSTFIPGQPEFSWRFWALKAADAFARRICVIWAVIAPGRGRPEKIPSGYCHS